MIQDLNIALVQFDLKWHQPEANRKRIDALIAGSNLSSTDLIVLPEMFTTGFTMEAEAVAEPMEGPTVNWMRERAERHQAVVTGTLAIKEHDQYFNRLIFARPNGELSWYDKRHLFRMADEHTRYTQGNEWVVFELCGWRIRPIICYDLRFPVWCRAQHNNYDVLLCPANWPDPRHQAWITLLNARALENQAYVIASNRIGVDAHAKNYLGNSKVIDAKGHTVADAQNLEHVITATLSRTDLDRFREKFPVHADADDFTLA